MKNFEQILEENGIQIPDDKKAAVSKAMGENYRSKTDYDKVAAKRDEYKISLDGVQEKLDGFKDVDVEALKGQISTLTTQLANEKADRQKDAARAAQEKNVESFLSGKKFVNALTEKSIRESLMAELEKDTAKGRSIEDIFKGITSDKDGNPMENILVSEADAAAAAGAAQFTVPAGKGPKPGSKYSISQLMKMKNENPAMDIEQYMKKE